MEKLKLKRATNDEQEEHQTEWTPHEPGQKNKKIQHLHQQNYAKKNRKTEQKDNTKTHAQQSKNTP